MYCNIFFIRVSHISHAGVFTRVLHFLLSHCPLTRALPLYPTFMMSRWRICETRVHLREGTQGFCALFFFFIFPFLTTSSTVYCDILAASCFTITYILNMIFPMLYDSLWPKSSKSNWPFKLAFLLSSRNYNRLQQPQAKIIMILSKHWNIWIIKCLVGKKWNNLSINVRSI